MAQQLPQGYALPPVLKHVRVEDVAWLGLLSTSVAASPVLTTVEQTRIKSIRDGHTDSRVTAYAQAVLTANSIAG